MPAEIGRKVMVGTGQPMSYAVEPSELTTKDELDQVKNINPDANKDDLCSVDGWYPARPFAP